MSWKHVSKTVPPNFVINKFEDVQDVVCVILGELAKKSGPDIK